MDQERGNWRFYTALLSHDVANFNQTTRGYLEMMLDEQMGPLSNVQTRALATCLRQCRRVQSLIDAMRLLDHLERHPPELEPVDLDEAVRAAVEVVQKEQSEQDIRVRFSPARRRVLAESHLLEVIRQLIGNAAQHNDKEIVEIDLELTETEDDPAMWRLLVRDNGGGVTPARKDGLFNRLDADQVHGSGVGLSLAAKLVERWEGKIWLEETLPEEGAVFGLELPLVE